MTQLFTQTHERAPYRNGVRLLPFARLLILATLIFRVWGKAEVVFILVVSIVGHICVTDNQRPTREGWDVVAAGDLHGLLQRCAIASQELVRVTSLAADQ